MYLVINFVQYLRFQINIFQKQMPHLKNRISWDLKRVNILFTYMCVKL